MQQQARIHNTTMKYSNSFFIRNVVAIQHFNEFTHLQRIKSFILFKMMADIRWDWAKNEK